MNAEMFKERHPAFHAALFVNGLTFEAANRLNLWHGKNPERPGAFTAFPAPEHAQEYELVFKGEPRAPEEVEDLRLRLAALIEKQAGPVNGLKISSVFLKHDSKEGKPFLLASVFLRRPHE
ncbi:MAG: hypothetical protein WC607_04090 [Candidatus Micrarchaeia archaeon]